ncbi:MAG: four helix bundle protein [Oscillospiraceae bacterium]|nr:four helix bundle protein [Oscillospiraceae bacterium]
MNNNIYQKSFQFAVRIVKLCKHLQMEQKEYILSKQVLRSGTSIGANVAEAQQAQSKPDFTSKINIALKEAAETDYWLRLLHETEYLSKTQFESMISDCDEIESILVSIVKSSKQ